MVDVEKKSQTKRSMAYSMVREDDVLKKVSAILLVFKTATSTPAIMYNENISSVHAKLQKRLI